MGARLPPALPFAARFPSASPIRAILAWDLRELGGVTAAALQGHEPLALISPALI
jgi:hypothetical protein